MIQEFAPTIKAPCENSKEWYINFHNIFYLSQLSGLSLLSYVDSFIEMTKHETIEENTEYLIKNKIIAIQEDQLDINEDQLKSFDIKACFEEIIERQIKNNFSQHDAFFMCMGLKKNDNLNKKININLDDLIKITNVDNWYDLLKGFLNIWEFLFLFSIVETTLKQILKSHKNLKSENLITNIHKDFPNLEKQMNESFSLSKVGQKHLWKYFLKLRNIYAHSHGFITNADTKNGLTGLIDNFSASLTEENDIFDQVFLNKKDTFNNSTFAHKT